MVKDNPIGSASSRGVAVRLSGVSKRFGQVVAVDDCSINVPPGSFLTLLGPSGSGKTTLLNLVAGFLRPDVGEVHFDEEPVTALPPHKRRIGMVFQSFALFPHMSVFDNVAFPLRMRTREGSGGIAAKVRAALDMVRLTGLADRRPHALSGGQRQRVAMARALVSRPPLLLLDEPLSALDKSLREELQVEIKALHRQVGSTFICVTHDQGEALAMSDLVVVMRDGRIEQMAPPQRLYREPRTAFVAQFLGGANLLYGVALPGSSERPSIDVGSGETLTAHNGDRRAGQSVQVLFRPETVSVVRTNGAVLPDPAMNLLRARIVETVFLGESVKIVTERKGQPIIARLAVSAAENLAPGDEVVLRWPVADTTLLEGTGG